MNCTGFTLSEKKFSLSNRVTLSLPSWKRSCKDPPELTQKGPPGQGGIRGAQSSPGTEQVSKATVSERSPWHTDAG